MIAIINHFNRRLHLTLRVFCGLIENFQKVPPNHERKRNRSSERLEHTGIKNALQGVSISLISNPVK
jgi:hypothetical protein